SDGHDTTIMNQPKPKAPAPAATTVFGAKAPEVPNATRATTIIAAKEQATPAPDTTTATTVFGAKIPETPAPDPNSATTIVSKPKDPNASSGVRKTDKLPVEVLEAQRDPSRVLGKYVLVKKLGRDSINIIHQAFDTL